MRLTLRRTSGWVWGSEGSGGIFWKGRGGVFYPYPYQLVLDWRPQIQFSTWCRPLPEESEARRGRVRELDAQSWTEKQQVERERETILGSETSMRSGMFGRKLLFLLYLQKRLCECHSAPENSPSSFCSVQVTTTHFYNKISQEETFPTASFTRYIY